MAVIDKLTSLVFLLFVLGHSVLFVLYGRLGERVGLWLLLFFVGVGTDRRRLNWVVAGIALLEAIAYVDACELSTLRHSDSSRPPQRLNHVDGIADGVAFATLSVLLSIADDFAEPGWLLTSEHRVLTDITEALDSWVLSLHLLHSGSLFFLGKVRSLMRAAACLQDYWVNVSPGLDVFELISLRETELLGELHLVGFLICCVEALGDDSSRMENASKCCSKVMALFASESWVCVDIRIQVSAEHVLD